eukprot:scaffold7350_cov233-Pinguiococcus_pyrenoidosus.AAC.4
MDRYHRCETLIAAFDSVHIWRLSIRSGHLICSFPHYLILRLPTPHTMTNYFVYNPHSLFTLELFYFSMLDVSPDH